MSEHDAGTALHRTVLHPVHTAAGARLVDFHGWEMPLNYGSQIAEHESVRTHVGLFDVSHMTIVDVDGDGARAYLRHLLANDVDKLRQTGRALYSLMLNERGGIVDDLIVYRRASGYRLVVNSATRAKDVAWLERHAGGFEVGLDVRDDLAMIAVQGPAAQALLVGAATLPLPHADLPDLKPFRMIESGDWMVARTGYTGEDGFELMLPGSAAPTCWSTLVAAGAAQCGLAARDTLRLEAGLNLYGQDMDEDTPPAVANVGWTVAAADERSFVGREGALEPAAERLCGIVLETRGVLRAGQQVSTSAGTGALTSGAFSPTLGQGIGFARVPRAAEGQCSVDVRGKALPARLVELPFVRRGRRVFE